ncbi:amidohydrolase family protein [Pseudooceanicola sp. GBMRC 2024]|uniref:Amidohydrolase family protein n=1 Tax=Pseudooceanicola albus TaxID=2692189 RepID=A0A6L7G334_9RHOB|nr:amidohydrolase family protein [Pseudooceanicola albus]MXN17810.1 amidohydrolase family protein [Pseudooceanicola albus]
MTWTGMTDFPPPGGEPPVTIVATEGSAMSVAVSPDGATLAIDLQGALWTLPATGGEATRISDLFDDIRQPVWSPDGSRIAYFAYREGSYHLWSVNPDGGDPQELTSGPQDDREPAWSPDGRALAFASDRAGQYDIHLLDLESRETRRLTHAPGEDRMPAWSADGRRIVFRRATAEGSRLFSLSLDSGCTTEIADAPPGAEAPVWSPDGRLCLVHRDGADSALMIGGKPVSRGEDTFPFRCSWTADGESLFHVADGRIRQRAKDGTLIRIVEMRAAMQVIRPHYPRRLRDWDSPEPRRAVGILHPAISPDGRQIAFVALGDLHLVPVSGGVPRNLTRDSALVADPAWSPDGRQLAYSSDLGGGLPQLWIRDLESGKARQVTGMATQPLCAAWSPDGTRIAFVDVDGRWGAGGLCVLEIESGAITRISSSLEQPGGPTWSPDGRFLAIALSRPFSDSFREGANQVHVFPADGSGPGAWRIRDPHLSIDVRGGGGPAWSPDGTMMAAIQEGLLKVWPVARDGTPLAPPRSVTSEVAHFPSWAGDSRTILFQAADRLATIDILTGERREVPLELEYRIANPEGRVILHVGGLIDCVRDATQKDKDIVIEGHRIVEIRDHDPARHAPGDRIVEAPHLTAIPGLIDHHVHVQRDFGADQYRAWLAYGVTTVRDTGNQVYYGAEDREAAEAGTRLSPRIYSTGPLLEWRRVFYKMGMAISSLAHLDRELDRAGKLRHDLIKSYVRMPDIAQRRMVEAAHRMGIPVATHEIYPAAFTGVDNTEHMGASSRRGYSPKHGPTGIAYDDVIQLFAASGRAATPTNLCVLPAYLERNPDYRDDPRLALYPAWAQDSVLVGDEEEEGFRFMVPDTLRSIKAMHDAGVPIAAGTDTAIAINLHSEIASYVDAGLTPFEALQAATVTPARQLCLDAGTLEAGRLADIVLVEGDPRLRIDDTFKVRTVVLNGQVHDLEALIAPRG